MRSLARLRLLALCAAAASGAGLTVAPPRPGGASPRDASPSEAATPLASYSSGRGEPAIVLVHALGVDHRDWDGVAARLGDGRRIIRVDLPGHGATPRMDPLSAARIAAALDSTLDALGVRRAVLVGHSYSGLVVLEAAAADAKRVRGVVIIDSGARTTVDSTRLIEMDEFLTTRYRVFVYAVFNLMSNDSLRAAQLVEEAHRVPQEVLTDYFRDAWRSDLRKRLGRVRTPVLLVATPSLWRETEPWDAARARLGLADLKSLDVRRLASSGHFVTRDAPDSLAAAIREFASSLRR